MQPNKIILIRHGESEGNVNFNIYNEKPDYALELTDNGKKQANEAGIELKRIVGDEKIAFYVSPMWRTRMTYEGLVPHFKKENCNFKEDPRLREQDWGHLRSKEETDLIIKERDDYSTFYYRFLHGESGGDVYDRISDFLGSLKRDFEKKDFPPNVVIITHGMSLRLFLMRWFHWTVEEFEEIANPHNCQLVIMKKNNLNKYDIVTNLTKHNVYHKYQRPVKL